MPTVEGNPGDPCTVNPVQGSCCPACGAPPVDPVSAYVGLPPMCRACFVEEDRRSEALELWCPPAFVLAGIAPDPAGDELEREARLAGVRPRRRRATSAEEFVGQRFGDLEVLAVARRPRRGDGRAVVCLRLRCACGSEYLAEAAGFRKRKQRSCRRCVARRVGRAQAQVLVGGETLMAIARRLGITHQAVRKRLARGWRLDQLGAPARRRAHPERQAA